MASIGTLTASLQLESAAFIRDMGRAQKAVASNTARMNKAMRGLESAGRGIERQFRNIRSAAIALAGALAVRQFTQFTRAALDAGSQIATTASKVGVGVEALQELRFAAEQVNVAQTALDMGLQRFSRRIGEVAQGTGELKAVAEQYDVQLRDTATGAMRANVDILKDFANVIQGAGSEQEKLRIAFKLFDSEGAALVNVFRDGSEGLERYMAQARAFGAVMSADVVKAADLASSNLKALQAVYSTSFNTEIVRSFAGGLTLTAENLQTARDVGQQFGNFVGTAMRGVAAAAKFAATWIREIAASLVAVVALKAATMFVGLAGAVVKYARALVVATRAGVLLDTVMSKTVLGTVAKLAVVIGAATLTWQAFGKEAMAATDAVDQAAAEIAATLGGGQSDMVGPIRKSTQEFEYQIEVNKQLIKAIRTSGAEYKRVSDLMEIEAERKRLDIDITSKQGAAWLDTAKKAQAYQRELADLENGMQFLEDAGSRAFDRVGSAITQAFTQGEGAAISFKSVAQGVISELMQSFFELAAINPIKNALFGGSAATLSSVGGLFGSIALPSLGSLFGGGTLQATTTDLRNMGSFADGGSFRIGSQFPKVDAGRDDRLVSFFGKSGEVVDVGHGGGRAMASGGQPVVINVDARESTNPAETEARIRRAIAQAVPSIVGAVADRRRRAPDLFGSTG